MRKPFDKTLYDIADTKAKKQMVGWLKDHDHSNIATDETSAQNTLRGRDKIFLERRMA